MAFLDRFKRKEQPTNLPPEYAQYYETASRGQRGKNILAAILGIALAIIIILVIGFGIRTLLNRNKDNAQTPNVPAVEENNKPSTSTTESTPSSPSSGSTTGSNTTPSSPSTPGTSATPSTGASNPVTVPSTGVDE